MRTPPSEQALRLHQAACEEGRPGYMDPDLGLFVMTSVGLRERGACCGQGCRHCPFSETERARRGRARGAPAWPWPATPPPS